MKDDEFGRQTLAGLNPCSIRLVKEWPLKSDLDPVKYGPPESAITKEVVEQQIFMTVEEAISQKKLFILNYHDLLLPYVHKGRGKPQWKHVYRPSWDFTTDWLWKLAKAHV